MAETPEPGWYTSPSGKQQWWDGAAWGEPAPEPDKAPEQKSERLVLDKKALAIWLAAAAVVAAVITAIALQNSPSAVAEREAKKLEESAPTFAEMACEDQVKERLKSPSTAEFSGVFALGKGDGEFEVTGTVDAQNGFGAMIRHVFSCEVEVEGDLTTTRNVTIH